MRRTLRSFRPFLFCFVSLAIAIATPGAIAGGPEDLVSGVTQITSQGSPGAIYPMSSAWWPIVGGDADCSFPSTLVVARQYGGGRVVALGHDGFFGNDGLLDNAKFLRNVAQWLCVKPDKSIVYSTGHGEWVGASKLAAFQQDIAGLGYSVQPVGSPLTASTLAGASVLLIGNAWSDFTPAEIEAVRQWVNGGGGLWLVAVGWSWEPYHPGSTLDDYPMMKVAGPYEVRWLRSGIFDPTDSLNGSAVFHTMFPNVEHIGVSSAVATIQAAHAAYGTGLNSALETSAPLRESLVHAHLALAIPSREFPVGHSDRLLVFDALSSLVTSYPASYAKLATINASAFPIAANLRERMWRTWRDCLPLTPQTVSAMLAASGLSERYRDLLRDNGVILLDNVALDAQQRNYIHLFLSRVPAELHNLESISVRDFLGTPSLEIPLGGSGGEVNIFGVRIGDHSENSFPADVSPGVVDVFSMVVAHEVNHIVDAFTIDGSIALRGRRDRLIADAGADPQNYLRSMFSPGFFVANPQEFFASISNQWFTDSVKTIELGLLRFDAGRHDPINQALFFADVYSLGSASTLLFSTDAAGNTLSRGTFVGRNEAGLLDEIVVGSERLVFSLDPAGRVIAYQRLCAADFDRNTFVNGDDFDSFALEFFWGTPAADFDGNGFTNGDDVDAFTAAFGAGC